MMYYYTFCLAIYIISVIIIKYERIRTRTLLITIANEQDKIGYQEKTV